MRRLSTLPFLLLCSALAVFASTGSAQTRASEPGTRPEAYTGILIQGTATWQRGKLETTATSTSVAVGAVLEGSPADSAGLRAGDVILEINGEDPRHQRPIPIMVPKVGETFVLRIRRGTTEHEITLVAAPRPLDLPSGKELWERERNKTGS